MIVVVIVLIVIVVVVIAVVVVIVVIMVIVIVITVCFLGVLPPIQQSVKVKNKFTVCSGNVKKTIRYIRRKCLKNELLFHSFLLYNISCDEN